PEVLEKVVAPVFAGIYGGDPEKLSVQSAFPQLKALDRGEAPRGTAGGPAVPAGITMFMTLKGGLSRLTDALALKLPPRCVRTGAAVSSLERRGGAWQVRAGSETYHADAVVSTLPAPVMSALLLDLDLELSTILREIPFSSTATVSFLYDAK